MKEAQSKRAFSEALERLMEQKPIAKIRVTDLVEDSGLSRQTFYRHVRDIYALIDWTHQEKTRLAFELIDVDADITHVWVVCLRLMARSKTFYQQVITTSGCNSFYNGYYLRCQNNLLRMAGGRERCDDAMLFTIRFTAAGITQMITEWITDGMAQPPEEMAKLLVESMPAKYLQAHKSQKSRG